MLMYLSDQTVPSTNISLKSVEVIRRKVIRFKLSDSNVGYWLEVRVDR